MRAELDDVRNPQMGKKMTIKDLRLNPAEDAYETLDVWSRRMGIPVGCLLAHAALGEFPVFISSNLSAHTLRYVETRRLNVKESEVDYPPPLSEDRIRKRLPYFSGRLIGLCLDSTHCESLAKGQEIRSPFFATAMFFGTSEIRLVDCKEDAWKNELPEGTCFAMFPTQAPHVFSGSRGWTQLPSRLLPDAVSKRTPEEYLRAPISYRITPGFVCARHVDIAKFVDRLASYAFIGDLFDGTAVIKEFPDFISIRLRVLIEANRSFFGNPEELTAKQKKLRRNQLENHVRSEYIRVCKNDPKTISLAEFGASVCDPYSKDARLPSTSSMVTLDLLSLLTAAKLFWLPYCSGPGSRETQPPSKSIVNFLQFMGLKKLNAGRSGTTLIAPNTWEDENRDQPAQVRIEWPITNGPLRPTL